MVDLGHFSRQVPGFRLVTHPVKFMRDFLIQLFPFDSNNSQSLMELSSRPLAIDGLAWHISTSGFTNDGSSISSRNCNFSEVKESETEALAGVLALLARPSFSRDAIHAIPT